MSVDVVTFGCRLNAYESQVMRDLAADTKDTIVVNTCAVTSEAERQARQAIRRLARERPTAKIVVTGCAVQISPDKWATLPNVTRVLGNHDKLQPKSWELDAHSSVSDIHSVRETSGHLVTEFAERARAFVQIQQGCDHHCTFCVIPQGRGPNRSVPIGAIAQQVHKLVQTGYQEVVFTGVDIASYGQDLPGSPSLGQMVKRVLANVPDLPRLRLSSIDPASIDEDLWRLLADEPRLMPHLHLSLQAASDMVLKRMRRRHLREDALAVIDRATTIRPGIALGADIIAGFPTETDRQFQETIDFVKETGIPYLHVFPYSERNGTPAARMPQVAPALRRERAARLRAEGNRNTEGFLNGLVGQTVQVLTETNTTGHCERFAPVSLNKPATIGSVVRAIVTNATPKMVYAEIA